jgi:carboxyl-terminal processing protease
VDWPANLSEADDLWRRQIKASVLSLRLADKDMPEIEKLIDKRYRSQLKRMAQVNSEDVFQLYMNSFTELFDPHTNYMSPRSAENFNMNMRLSLEGIGAVLQQEDEFTKVARLVPAGPADKQGELRAADRIISVGQDESGDMTDVVGWRLDEVVDLIRGPKGSVVRLEIARGRDANEERKIVSIVRDKVKLEEQAAQSEILELFYDGALHKLGVIDIPAFYADFEAMQRGDPNFRSTTRDVARLLSELQKQHIEGIIIDLRDNGGGSLQEANALTGLFIESGPTVQIRHSNERVERKQKFRSEGYYSGPLVVLINRLSASASEIFAGAIQDYRRGIVVGSQSFGKGTVQSLTSLNHGHLKLTESKFYRISGDSTQHRGVLPDVEFPTLYDPAEVGESALDNALPWDRIAPVRHRRYQDLDSILGTVRERHEARVSHDPDFAYLRGELELAEKLDARKTISLNEAVRRKERQERQEAALSLENKRRLGKGMEPLSSLDELDAEAEGGEAEDGAAEATTPDSDEREARDDILLTEAGNVLLDAIQLTQRVAARN